MTSILRKTFLVSLLALGCAGAPPPHTETARLKDSPPERAAALRAADRPLGLEAEEQRWGIAAARERREAAEQRKRAPPAPPAPGPVDLRGGPGAPPAGDHTPQR